MVELEQAERAVAVADCHQQVEQTVAVVHRNPRVGLVERGQLGVVEHRSQ